MTKSWHHCETAADLFIARRVLLVGLGPTCEVEISFVPTSAPHVRIPHSLALWVGGENSFVVEIQMMLWCKQIQTKRVGPYKFTPGGGPQTIQKHL